MLRQLTRGVLRSGARSSRFSAVRWRGRLWRVRSSQRRCGDWRAFVSGPEPLGPFAVRRCGISWLYRGEEHPDRGPIGAKPHHSPPRSSAAAELVRSKVDVIVAIQTPAVYAAKGATRTSPLLRRQAIQLLTGADPQPGAAGRNLTGLSGAAVSWRPRGSSSSR